MLGDTTKLLVDNVGAPEVVEKSCLPMVDVAHDCDYWGPGLTDGRIWLRLPVYIHIN